MYAFLLIFVLSCVLLLRRINKWWWWWWYDWHCHYHTEWRHADMLTSVHYGLADVQQYDR